MAAHDASVRCKDGNGGLSLYTMPGTLIFDQREKLAQVALKEGCDAILYIDSDMRFPPDLITIMLSREVGILGVNAVTRRKPCMPTTKLLVKSEDEKGIRHHWSNVDSRGKEGIEKVTAVGFGAVMIRREVFEKVPQAWFDAGWGPTGVVGEDVHFCVKAGDNGFDTFVDHELSMHIKHIGTYEYGWDDFEQLEE
jgi:GT2 family glycosyltransferase